MQTIGERIDNVIRQSGLNKTRFAERLHLSQQFISSICSGVKQPSDRTVTDICREFGVSEMWLRTGEGEMFPPRDNMEDLLYLSGRFFSSEPTEFQQRFARMMYSLTPEEWALLEKKARFLLGQEE